MRLRKLRKEAAEGNPQRLITLTINPEQYLSPDHAARTLVKAWRNIVQRAHREGIAERIEYICIFEETKRGWPHLHILARCPYLPQRWLSARMREYANSPIVDVRAVKSRRAASCYVAKYVSKGPGGFDRCKRYWRSRGYCDPQNKPDKPVQDCRRGWRSELPWVGLADWHLRWGWEAIEDTDHSATLVPGPQAWWLAPIPPPPEVADLHGAHPCH